MNYGTNALPLQARYSQSRGLIAVVDADLGAAVIGRGYAGRGSARNNPRAEREVARGPLPVGVYEVGTPMDHKRLGRFAIPLAPVQGDLFGRSGFFIHGDNAKRNGTASSGCIVTDYDVRYRLMALGIRRLTVVAD